MDIFRNYAPGDNIWHQIKTRFFDVGYFAMSNFNFMFNLMFPTNYNEVLL